MAERAYDSIGEEIKRTFDPSTLNILAAEARDNRQIVAALLKQKNAIHPCLMCPLNPRTIR